MKVTKHVLASLKEFGQTISKSMKHQARVVQAANKLKEQERIETMRPEDKPGAWRKVENPEENPLVKYERPANRNKLWTF